MLCRPVHAMSGESAVHRSAAESEVKLVSRTEGSSAFTRLRAPATTAQSPPPSSRPMLLARPTNYGTIKEGSWYRSGFPEEENLDFLESLGIRSIVTLVDSPPSEAFLHHVKRRNVDHKHVILAANKDGKVLTTNDSLCEVLAFILNPANFPVYIHCNHGKHRTGCVVGCLRKVQGWPLDEILAEYEAYASPKARPADIELITNFDPQCLLAYAQTTSDLEWVRPKMREVNDVFALARRAGSLRDAVLVADLASCDTGGV